MTHWTRHWTRSRREKAALVLTAPLWFPFVVAVLALVAVLFVCAAVCDWIDAGRK